MMMNEDIIYYNEKGKPHPGYYLHRMLKSNMDIIKKGVKKKWDGIILVTGMEGSGKTTFGAMLANYCDPTFPGEPLNDGTPRRHCDRVVFNSKQILKAIDESKPGQAILIDEAILSMAAQDASAEFQKILIKKFTLIRKKGLYIFLIIPNPFMLRRYFMVFRTRAMIHCYTPDGFSRGYFRAYSYTTKKKLYMLGYKQWDMNVVKANFNGKFVNTNNYFYDPDEYEEKKDRAIEALSDMENKKKEPTSLIYKKMKAMRDMLIYKIYVQRKFEGGEITSKELSKVLHEAYSIDIKPRSIPQIIKEGEAMQKFVEEKGIEKTHTDDYAVAKSEFKFQVNNE